MKILINTCFGGFRLSDECKQIYLRRLAAANETPLLELNPCRDDTVLRTDPVLIQLVQELGPRASSRNSRLEVIEIPDGVDWVIQEYDGIEWVAERHRRWGPNPYHEG